MYVANNFHPSSTAKQSSVDLSMRICWEGGLNCEIKAQVLVIMPFLPGSRLKKGGQGRNSGAVWYIVTNLLCYVCIKQESIVSFLCQWTGQQIPMPTNHINEGANDDYPEDITEYCNWNGHK